MFNEYSLEVSRIFKWAEKEMFELKHPYVGTEHLLLSLLKNNNDVSNILKKYHVTYDTFRNELISVIGAAGKKSEFVLYTPLLKRIINNTSKDMTPLNLLKSLIEEDEGIAIRILIGMGVNLELLYRDLKENNDCTELLNVGINLQDTVNMSDMVIGRDKEINDIISILIRKNKNNPLLIGDAGVGKTAIVEELARRINKGLVPNCIKKCKIIVLNISSLVAGTKYRGEFEEKLNKIIKEVENNSNIILFIDEIHTIVNAGGAEGAVNASDILKPYMARNTIKIIGATTTNEYSKYILKDKALARRFEVLKIQEPDIENTINIIYKIKDNYEKHYNIQISLDNIKTLVEYADKYIKNKYNPDKSIAILDSLCAKKSLLDNTNNDYYNKELFEIRSNKNNMVQLGDFKTAMKLLKKEKDIMNKINYKKELSLDNEEIINYIKEICHMTGSNFNLTKIKSYLKKEIIGQDNVIDNIINSLEKKEEDRPISILLTGSTGVGKTKTVKEFSKCTNIPLIKLDMSEYSDTSSINRLIGSSAGYIGYDDENIFDKIKMQPRTILLFDEIEKSNPSVMNLLLQILDEGIITNAKGEKIDFRCTYIFMTSNAKGRKKIGFMKQQGDYEDYFSKEFLARLTTIIEYNDITKEILKKYLKKNGIKNNSIIDKYDFKKLGLRGIDKMIHV